MKATPAPTRPREEGSAALWPMTEAGCGSSIRNAPSLRLGRVAEWQHPARLVAGLLAHGVAEVPRDSPSRSPADGGVASLFLAKRRSVGRRRRHAASNDKASLAALLPVSSSGTPSPSPPSDASSCSRCSSRSGRRTARSSLSSRTTPSPATSPPGRRGGQHVQKPTPEVRQQYGSDGTWSEASPPDDVEVWSEPPWR